MSYTIFLKPYIHRESGERISPFMKDYNSSTHPFINSHNVSIILFQEELYDFTYYDSIQL